MRNYHLIFQFILMSAFLIPKGILAQNQTDPENGFIIRKAVIDIDQRDSGDKQYQVTDRALDHPLVVRVLKNSKPLPNYPVYFSILTTPKKAKHASISHDVVLTDKNGFAPAWVKLGSSPGEYIFSARINDGVVGNDMVIFKTHARNKSWVFFLVMGLVGGLGLFLFGMEMMSDGMKKTAGNRMRSILEKLTTNRVIAAFVGIFVTMVIQSSSATTVMLVSFVHAGLMTFVQSLGVILGSNIGTTVTAQIIAFKVTDYALLMIAIGIGFRLFGRKDSQKYLGEIVLGFGMLFLGMHLMSKAMSPLRDYQAFINILQGLENPALGILAGAVFTALVQSSSAFTSIVIVLAMQGVLTLTAGIPLILGANIGTCITAGLASITASREAKRVALAHVLFNVAGVLIFVAWIPYFAEFVRWLSPQPETGLTGAAALSAVVPRQIANAHTIFNVFAAIIFLPFTKYFANLIVRILPDKILDRGIQPTILYLDYGMISTPAVAINLAIAEISSMARLLDRMIKAIIEPILTNESKKDVSHPQLNVIEGIQMREEKIDYLEYKVSDYLLQISRQNLDQEQAMEIFGLLSVVNNMESIGDIIDNSLLPLVRKKQNLKSDFSEEGKKEIRSYHKKVMKQVHRLEGFFDKFKMRDVEKIMKKKSKYSDLQYEYLQQHLKRVGNEKVESISTHLVHVNLMDMLKQINVYIGDIAKTLYEVVNPDAHITYWDTHGGVPKDFEMK